MSVPDELNFILDRIVKHQQTETDIIVLRQWISGGSQIVSQQGKYAVNLGQGQEIHIGDRIYQGADAEVIREIVRSILEELKVTGQFATSQQQSQQSVDELVQKVRSRIHDHIQRLYGTMPLWGVDHWVPLGDLFVDVNILEELSSSRKSELDDLWQDFTTGMQRYSGDRSLDRIGLGRERQRVSGLEVLAKNTNLMVVGKPGSGKTTYLQRVVTECNTGNLQAHRIPALIKLREFVDDGREFTYSLERYFERCWQLSNAEINLIFNQGRALVLLDGLDEVTGEDGKNIAKQIKQFARDYPQVQVIVTCRTQSQESRFERFDYVEVADFNETQVRSFAKHWFNAVMEDDSAKITWSQEFLYQLFLETNKPIRDLAITPILLSLTCAVFHQTGKFYSKRSKLYEEGLELLLEQWDKSREIERDEIYRDLSLERKLELLSYLAVKKFEQPQYVLFEQAEIEGYIAEFLVIGLRDSRAVLRAIESQHGLLIERSQKVWSFSHLTFQEYLVAKWFGKQSILENLAQHFVHKHWREVCLLASEIVDDPQKAGQFIRKSKENIDISFIDNHLDNFLEQLHQKAAKSRSVYNPEVVRAFYFDISFLRTMYTNEINEDGESITPAWFNLPGSNFATLLGDFNLTLLLSHNISICFDFGFISYDPREKAFGDVCNYSQINTEDDLGIDMILANLFIILTSFTTDYAELSSKDVYSKVLSIIIKTVNILYRTNLENDLRDFCERLVHEINDIKTNKKKFQKWFKIHAQKKIEELQNLLEKCRGIQFNWNFTKNQLDLLIEYYTANILLLECLNINNAVSSEFKQEIKKVLLLPIAEIKKCKCETAK